MTQPIPQEIANQFSKISSKANIIESLVLASNLIQEQSSLPTEGQRLNVAADIIEAIAIVAANICQISEAQVNIHDGIAA
ncbi:MAG: hypothetical protein ABI536_06095 [Gallionella sp.]